MNKPISDITRVRALWIVSALCVTLFGILFSCAGFGLPSVERIQAVYGAPRFSDTDIEWMTTSWKKLESAEGSSRVLLNSGVLNDSQALSPAEIDRIRALRRMALYTTEPDEMHVPLALGRMKPKQFDFNPHFFQYGGFFFYGCGLFAGLAGLFGFIPISGGLDPYVRDPSLMGNMYLAAKFWTIFWSALLPFFVYRLARLGMSRTRSCLAALLAMSAPGLYVFGPVLKQVSMAGSLSVLAVWLGCRLLSRARMRDFILAGAAMGLAGATFVTQFVIGAGLIWVIVELRIREKRLFWKEFMAGCAAAGFVFVLFNPYWVLDYRTVLSDAKHAMAWYKPDVNRVTVYRVLSEVLPASIGWPILIGGVIAILRLFVNPLGRCIAAYTLAVTIYYGWRITGVPDLGPFWSRQFLMVGPLWAILILFLMRNRSFATTAIITSICVFITLPQNSLTIRNYRMDASIQSTRYVAGRWIDANIPEGETIYVTQQPGPFSTPFFNLNAHPVKPASSPDSMPLGAVVVSVAKPNEYGNERFFHAMELVKEFPSERNFLGVMTCPEAIGFANGPVGVWRRVR